MNRRLKHAAIIFIVVLAAAQLVRPERRRADWSPSWIGRAATVTQMAQCGRGTPKSRPCPG